MTKYVLNSGGLKNNPKRAKEFFEEILKGLGSNPKILICCFAQPREDWEIKFAQDKEGIVDLAPKGVSPILELALPSKFEEQIRDSNVVYIHGGDDHLIKYWFKKFNVPNIWKNKVVATSSAGSNVLSKHFWTCDWRELMDGLGILQIKFLSHYKSSYGKEDPRGPVNWKNGYEELTNYKDKLPLYALEEGDYVVIEDN